MKYAIMSVKEAVDFEPDVTKKNVMIRLLEPRGYENPALNHPEAYQDILELFIDDLTEEQFERLHLYGSNFKLFSNDDAKHVVDFFEKHHSADNFIIHCQAGISRSAAVALGLAEFIQSEGMKKKIIESGRYAPNETVLDRIVKEIRKRVNQKNNE